jgi:hypothetical protein
MSPLDRSVVNRPVAYRLNDLESCVEEREPPWLSAKSMAGERMSGVQ